MPSAGRRSVAASWANPEPGRGGKADPRASTAACSSNALKPWRHSWPTGRTLADQADALAAGSEIPHRQANALYCRGLLDRDTPRLLDAAERYSDAGRPLQRAKALEAAVGHFVDADDRTEARAAFTAAVDVYTSLGAAADIARLQAEFVPAHPARAARQAPAGAHS